MSDTFLYYDNLKSPLETIKVASIYNKDWIPAFAGMTPVGLKLNPLKVIPAKAGTL